MQGNKVKEVGFLQRREIQQFFKSYMPMSGPQSKKPGSKKQVP